MESKTLSDKEKSNGKKRIKLIAFMLVVLGSGCGFIWFLIEKPDRLVDCRAVYNHLINKKADILNVQEPIELVSSSFYADGGTMDFKFRDATNKEFYIVLPVEKPQYLFGETFPLPAALGLSQDSSVPAPLASQGKEEQALCGLLMRWAKQHPEFSLLMVNDKKNNKKYRRWLQKVYQSSGDESNRGWALIFTGRLMIRQIN